MKATEAKLLDFLKKSPQFVIPIYQRSYSWTEKQCRQLWDDILRVGATDNVALHFIGSIVYVEQGLSQVSAQSPLLVIDGQQGAHARQEASLTWGGQPSRAILDAADAGLSVGRLC